MTTYYVDPVFSRNLILD